MLYTVPRQQVKAIFSPLQVSQPQEAAQWIIDTALKHAYTKLAMTQQELPLDLLLGQPDFFGDFKYGLAKGIGQVLSANDERVTAVYTFEPSANPDLENGEELPVEATVHLLVVVKKPSAALDAFIAGVDRALTQSAWNFPSPLLATGRSLLNIVILTADEVERGTGYASLLSSMFTPPMKVWSQQQ